MLEFTAPVAQEHILTEQTLINQEQIPPDAMTCTPEGRERFSAPSAAFRRGAAAGRHRRRPDLPTALQGVGVKACARQTRGNDTRKGGWGVVTERWMDVAGERSEHSSLLLSELDMWENYKPTCCVMLCCVPSPTRSCRIGQGRFIFPMPSSLRPSDERDDRQ